MTSTEDLEKIKLVDQVFKSLSLDEIKSILGADLIVNKLKGTDTTPGPILSSIQDLSMLRVEIATLRADHTMLKEDFKMALRAIQTLSAPHVPYYSAEMQTLKSKYGVY